MREKFTKEGNKRNSSNKRSKMKKISQKLLNKSKTLGLELKMLKQESQRRKSKSTEPRKPSKF